MIEIVAFDYTLGHEMWSKRLYYNGEKWEWCFLGWLTFSFFWIEGNREIWALKEGWEECLWVWNDRSSEDERKRVEWALEIMTQQDENQQRKWTVGSRSCERPRQIF